MYRSRPNLSLAQRVHSAFDASEQKVKALDHQRKKARRLTANLKYVLERGSEFNLSPGQAQAIRKALLVMEQVAERKERSHRAAMGANGGGEVSVRQMSAEELAQARAERGMP